MMSRQKDDDRMRGDFYLFRRLLMNWARRGTTLRIHVGMQEYLILTTLWICSCQLQIVMQLAI